MTDATSGVSRIRIVDGGSVSAVDLAFWNALRDADPVFDSPFFDPRFAEAVHASGVPVSVLFGESSDGEVLNVWPLQREGSVLRPAGWPAADFQGPVGSSYVDPVQILEATGARTLHFDHLREGVGVPEAHVAGWRVSPYLDVRGGLPGYLERASRSGKDNMGQARRKARKAEARYGAPVTFTVDDRSPDVLDQLIELKRRQYAATGARDYFGRPDRVRLLRHLLAERDNDFGGVLSTLRCGETLIASHFGLRSSMVLHWWFPVYEPAAADLSPGWMLLRELTAAATALDVRRIDLGRGEDEYKRRAMTGESRVGEGELTVPGVGRVVRDVSRVVRGWIRSTGIAPAVRRRFGSLARGSR